jgi:hypothetical protein
MQVGAGIAATVGGLVYDLVLDGGFGDSSYATRFVVNTNRVVTTLPVGPITRTIFRWEAKNLHM